MSRKPNPEARVRVAFEIPWTVRQQIADRAAQQGTTMTALVRQALIQFVEGESRRD